jgi:hypothetical protein
MNLLRKINRIPDPLLQESKDYLANINAAGGSIKMESLVSCDRFIRACMAAGIWTKLIEVYPICGNDLTSALVKLKYASNPLLTSVNFVAADFIERGASAGIAGDGSTKYLNTNCSTQNLAATGHLAAYMREVETVGSTRYWIGANSASDFYLLGLPGSNPAGYWGGNVQQVADSSAPTVGLYQLQRESGTSLSLYLNAAARGSNNNSVSQALPNQNIFLHCRNNAGSPASYTPKRFSFFSIGASMTANERTAFSNAVIALQSALERNV